MKLQELLNLFIDTQQVKVISTKDNNNIFYEGIKAGCLGGFSSSRVNKVLVQDNALLIEVDYEMASIMSSSNEELLDMYFDESELDVDLEALEQKLFKLSGELGDILGDL